jgi:hypothetical protein
MAMASSGSPNGAPHKPTTSFRILLVALSSFLCRSVAAQTPLQKRYVISLGTASERLASGSLWVYSYSWYGLQQFKLATIQDGRAVVPLDTDRLKREVDPHPNTDAYVVAIQIGENLWYRTPDIEPNDFWADLSRAIQLLGEPAALPTGEMQLILPQPTKRRITLLYPDGRPKANTNLTVSLYLWDQNHCGVHTGLPLGTSRTDDNGTVEVLAQRIPLYLDGLEYYHNVGTGPAGVAYSSNIGMKLGPEAAVVVREQWELKSGDSITVEMQILTTSGRPRRNVDIYGNWNTNSCGGADRIGQTDATVIARIDLNPTFTALSLMVGGPYSAGDPKGDANTRDLTDAELRELFTKHKLTIRWGPVAKQVTPMLARPLGYWTSTPVNCENVSGKWADPENAETWNLNQIGENITVL